MDDDDAPIACWVCGRVLNPDEPLRLIPILPDDPRQPPTMTGIACLGCYQGRQQTYVPGLAEGRLTSRMLRIPAAEFAS